MIHQEHWKVTRRMYLNHPSQSEGMTRDMCMSSFKFTAAARTTKDELETHKEFQRDSWDLNSKIQTDSCPPVREQ